MLDDDGGDTAEHAADWENHPVDLPELHDETEDKIDNSGNNHDDGADFAEAVLVGFGDFGIVTIVFGDVIFFFLDASIDNDWYADRSEEQERGDGPSAFFIKEIAGLERDKDCDSDD